MTTVLLVIHLMIALALVGMVLVQRSEGGALGMGGSGAGGGFMTGRGTANLLTRTTVWLAGAFFASSLGLTLLSQPSTKPGSVFDAPVAPASAPAPAGTPAAPATPPAAGATPPADAPATPAAPPQPRGGILDKLQQNPGGAPPRAPQPK